MRISKKNLVFQNRGLRLQIFQERWIIICFEAHFQFQKKAYLLFFFFFLKKKKPQFQSIWWSINKKLEESTSA